MSEKSTVTCDVCGIDRAECNGWWSYRTDEKGFHVDHADGRKGRSHACGHSCVHKALDAFLTVQIIQPVIPAPIPNPTPQAEQESTVKEEPENLVRGKGLTVEGLVAEQGGDPEDAVYEGSVPVVIDGEIRMVGVYEPLPYEEGEAVKIPKPSVDEPQIENQFDAKSN
jgi:hypothetical protein